MDSICKAELGEAKKYSLTIKDGLVELSRRNVAIVENMIRTDSKYRKSFNKDAGPSGDYMGSSAYWLTQLEYKYPEDIQNVVIALDIENSTHLNTDSVGRKELTKRITDACATVDELKKTLKDDKKYLELVNRLAEKTNPDNEMFWMESRDPNKKYYSRKNLSFASKFCHYASYYLLDDKYMDEFSIYDDVIKRKLPDYLTYYNVPFGREELEDYIEYNELIGKVLDKSAERISRRGFDQLIWYYYK